MTVCYACDQNLYPYLKGITNSLIYNNPEIEKIYIFIKEPVTKEQIGLYNSKIELRSLNECLPYLDVNSYSASSKWGIMTMVRCAFSKILTEDKILYLDVDTLVRGNISGLFDIDMDNYYIAGAKEPFKTRKLLYINAAVTLFNLKKIREDKIDDKLLQVLNDYWLAFPDQDAMNMVFRDHILELNPIVNCSFFTGIVKNPLIVHESQPTKPWQFQNKYYQEYLKYSQMDIK